MSEEKTLYEYCKDIVTLYELEAELHLLGIDIDKELGDVIVYRILDIEEELRAKIKGGKL